MANISSMKKDSKRSPNSIPKNKRKIDVRKKLGTEKKRKIELGNKRVQCYAPDKPKTEAMERAETIQDNLPLDSISLVRDMQPSHVSGGFWLGLQKTFCDVHLPNHDETIILSVDGVDHEKKIKYLATKNGLSGGWKGFSIKHGLLEGDVLVFQLIKPCKFIVHIVRATLKENDNATIGETSKSCIPKMTMSASMLFKEVKCLEDFEIHVNGSILEIPKQVKQKYYNLCKSQNKYLHENLILVEEGFDSKEAARVISETVNIADAIEVAAKCSSLDLVNYGETLERFEGLGMEVGFLRGRIDKISGRQCVLESKRKELKEKEHRMRGLESKLTDVWFSIEKCTREIRSEADKFQAVFAKTAGAPWRKLEH